MMVRCKGMRGNTPLTVESATGKKHYHFEAHKTPRKMVGRSNLANKLINTNNTQTGNAVSTSKRTSKKKKRPTVRLATKVLKTNYEKSLMKALLHATSKWQKHQQQEIKNMDFQLSPIINLPHQLYSKNSQLTSAQLGSQTTSPYQSSEPIPEYAEPILKSKPPKNPFSSYSSHPNSPKKYGPAPNFPPMPSALSTTVRDLESSKEPLQMHALKTWI